MERKRFGILLLTLVSLIAGGLIGYAAHSSTTVHSSLPPRSVSSQSSDLRVQYHSLLQEHAPLTVAALSAQFLGDPDTDAITQQVDNNSAAIAAAISSALGVNKDQFLALWRKHTAYYNDYLAATKAGDGTAKQKAKDNLTAFATDLTTLLATDNPELDSNELKLALSEHGNQVVSIIDELDQGNYDSVYKTSQLAYGHMGKIADMLAEAVSEQALNK